LSARATRTADSYVERAQQCAPRDQGADHLGSLLCPGDGRVLESVTGGIEHDATHGLETQGTSDMDAETEPHPTTPVPGHRHDRPGRDDRERRRQNHSGNDPGMPQRARPVDVQRVGHSRVESLVQRHRLVQVGGCDAVVQSDLVGDQVVMRDVEAGSTVVVSPARPLDQDGSPRPLGS
jgi:hypothetical protein